jgi:hypothetical protein
MSAELLPPSDIPFIPLAMPHEVAADNIEQLVSSQAIRATRVATGSNRISFQYRRTVKSSAKLLRFEHDSCPPAV